MRKTISLKQYVKKRTGLPLGANGSLSAMLKRSLGANDFQTFWVYWNPIWSYYLSKFVHKPLCAFLPVSMATLGTFVVSGFAHDVAVTILKLEPTFIITPWFLVIGLMVVLSEKTKLSFKGLPFAVKTISHIAFIALSYLIARAVLNY